MKEKTMSRKQQKTRNTRRLAMEALDGRQLLSVMGAVYADNAALACPDDNGSESVEVAAQCNAAETNECGTPLFDLWCDGENPVWDHLPHALMEDDQVNNVNDLLADLNQIKSESEVTSDQVVQLRTDLSALIKAAVSKEDVEAFVQGLQTALDDGELSEEEKEQLLADLAGEEVATFVDDLKAAMEDGEVDLQEALGLRQDIQAIRETSTVPPELVEAVKSDIEEIKEASHVDYPDVKTVAEDIRTIKREFEENRSERQDRRSVVVDPIVDRVYETRFVNYEHPIWDVLPKTGISDEQVQNVEQLFEDLDKIKQESDLPELVKQLLTDWEALTDNAQMPPEDAVAALVEAYHKLHYTYQDATTDDPKTPLRDESRITEEEMEDIAAAFVDFQNALNAVRDEAGLTQDDLQPVNDDVDAIRLWMQSSKRENLVTAVRDDIEAIVTTLVQNQTTPQDVDHVFAGF